MKERMIEVVSEASYNAYEDNVLLNDEDHGLSSIFSYLHYAKVFDYSKITDVIENEIPNRVEKTGLDSESAMLEWLELNLPPQYYLHYTGESSKGWIDVTLFKVEFNKSSEKAYFVSYPKLKHWALFLCLL